MTFALNRRTMSRPPSCTFCTLFCYIFTLFSLLKTNPSSIKWMLQQALIKHIFFFIISQFCCLGHSERWLLAGCLIKTKIQSEMVMIMKFLFPCYKFRYYSRSRIYYKYNTEANEDRKMSPTLAGSHLSVLMCLHCNA